jgi:hypothetical protein
MAPCAITTVLYMAILLDLITTKYESNGTMCCNYSVLYTVAIFLHTAVIQCNRVLLYSTVHSCPGRRIQTKKDAQVIKTEEWNQARLFAMNCAPHGAID